ncbi:hypothetical protein CHO01_39090 [Cellulomonas hominis]|uniref:H+/Cl- antiporter ClcA n=1 Tax=Cellulomonas hominis TaxID=156981 RepID=A0A511FHV0_9CELL|nr:chloride channel protein [Cellulomonas hominis]MBB5475152.1 H+/Cl- antiporter ClcA [Cellulomonas hominis]GEL48793.1 hypothetical protein CHO01_39090 [Cellulomonas hominis]
MEAPHPVLGADPSTLHSRAYVRLLVLSAVLGVPVSAAAWGFLHLVSEGTELVYDDLPSALGMDGTPAWWGVPWVGLGGLLVGLCIRYLPGRGGHVPVNGFSTGAPPPAPREIAGVALAALAGLTLGAVIGPEAPLIALGAGATAWAARLLRRDLPERAVLLLGAAGSFAAISLLIGNPLVGAFLLMEASALGGAALGLVLLPGLLAAGIGALVMVGLGSVTGLGVVALTIPDLPTPARPDLAQLGWAVAIGLVAPLLGWVIVRVGRAVAGRAAVRPVAVAVVVGLAVGALAWLYAGTTGHDVSEVLLSGQEALGPLLLSADDHTVGALLLLLLCKGAGYGLSLGALRGGPVFPAMFLGAAGGLALSHLPGLPALAGAAMGIGAMSVVMLRLPLTSVLLATLLLGSGLTLMPLVIVAVVVAHVGTAWLRRGSEQPAPAPAAPA